MRPDIEKTYEEYLNQPPELRPKKLGLDDFLDFGKYKGEQIEDILEDNPSYLIWIIDEGVRGIEFDEEVTQKLMKKGY